MSSASLKSLILLSPVRMRISYLVLLSAVLNCLLFLKHAKFLSPKISSSILYRIQLYRIRIRRKCFPASASRALVYTGSALATKAVATQMEACTVQVCASYEGWICICLMCFFFGALAYKVYQSTVAEPLAQRTLQKVAVGTFEDASSLTTVQRSDHRIPRKNPSLKAVVLRGKKTVHLANCWSLKQRRQEVSEDETLNICTCCQMMKHQESWSSMGLEKYEKQDRGSASSHALSFRRSPRQEVREDGPP